MGKSKSHGPNDYNVKFYLAFWDKIKESLLATFQKFHTEASIPNAWGKIINKILSRVFNNRIKPLLNTLVNQIQSIFILGRNIHDNILITKELAHILSKSHGKVPLTLLKIDISKASDSVN